MSAKDEILRAIVEADLARRAMTEPSADEIVRALTGPQGEVGPEGPQGPTGPSGADGRDGRDGRDGTDGLPGEKGPRGPTGEKGDRGEPGYGSRGPAGPPGRPGGGGGSGSGVPPGGTTGEVLTKLSDTSGDADWEAPAASDLDAVLALSTGQDIADALAGAAAPSAENVVATMADVGGSGIPQGGPLTEDLDTGGQKIFGTPGSSGLPGAGVEILGGSGNAGADPGGLIYAYPGDGAGNAGGLGFMGGQAASGAQGGSMGTDGGQSNGTGGQAVLIGGDGAAGKEGGPAVISGGSGDEGDDAGASIIVGPGSGAGHPGDIVATGRAFTFNAATIGTQAANVPAIADPTAATAESNALVINAILAALIASGEMAPEV
jgi:hypothetical protein